MRRQCGSILSDISCCAVFMAGTGPPSALLLMHHILRVDVYRVILMAFCLCPPLSGSSSTQKNHRKKLKIPLFLSNPVILVRMPYKQGRPSCSMVPNSVSGDRGGGWRRKKWI